MQPSSRSVVSETNQTPRGEPLNVEGHKGGQFFFYPKMDLIESEKVQEEAPVFNQKTKQVKEDTDAKREPIFIDSSEKSLIPEAEDVDFESLNLKPKIDANGKYGFVNRASGEWVIRPKYEKSLSFLRWPGGGQIT